MPSNIMYMISVLDLETFNNNPSFITFALFDLIDTKKVLTVLNYIFEEYKFLNIERNSMKVTLVVISSF